MPVWYINDDHMYFCVSFFEMTVWERVNTAHVLAVFRGTTITGDNARGGFVACRYHLPHTVVHVVYTTK